MQAVISQKCARSFHRPDLDPHRLVDVKDHGARIAVGGRQVGKPFGITAEPVVGRLDDESIDAARSHFTANCVPATLEFGG
ncbi:MAG: hypothetical protein WAU53_13335 [Rhodoplanes sp.]